MLLCQVSKKTPGKELLCRVFFFPHSTKKLFAECPKKTLRNPLGTRQRAGLRCSFTNSGFESFFKSQLWMQMELFRNRDRKNNLVDQTKVNAQLTKWLGVIPKQHVFSFVFLVWRIITVALRFVLFSQFWSFFWMDSSLIGPSGEVVTCVFFIVLLSNKKYGKSLAVFKKKALQHTRPYT